MKIPFVREWGSWVVFIASVSAALIASSAAGPSGRVSGSTAFTIAGLTFLINSKNPLTSAIRSGWKKKGHAAWFLFFSISGIALMAHFLVRGIRPFSPFSLLAVSYAALLLKGKEHSIIAELNGFALLTLTAPVVYFSVTGDLSLRLYAAVFLFFAAGVFKVRVRIRKTLKYRWIMALYCAGAALIYFLLNINLVILLPLIENILSVLFMREEKLRATGYTELTKGVLFLALLALFWQ
jgi:hypothetical protein